VSQVEVVEVVDEGATAMEVVATPAEKGKENVCPNRSESVRKEGSDRSPLDRLQTLSRPKEQTPRSAPLRASYELRVRVGVRQ
jgi:hypothetical protein